MRAAIFLLAAAWAPAAELRIRVTDETGAPIWARLEVHAPDGKLLQPEGAILSGRPGAPPRTAYTGSFVVNGECRLDVAPGRYRIVAEHGLEYERVERLAGVKPSGASAAIRLKPWVRMRSRGWWSGDMHVHRPVEDARALVQAEDLNVGVVFTMWNRQNLWSGKALPPDPAIAVTPNHLLTILNAEDERGGGAWMLHHLREPLGIEKVLAERERATESWFPPGIEFVKQARAQRAGGLFPWFDSEKPIWWEVPVMMAVAPPDSLGLLHNHYNQYTMLANEAWGRPRDTARFPGLEGFSDYSLSLIYRYLNLGFRIPLSAGAASGVLPNPVGYNRMYVKLDGPLTVESWYRAVRTGPILLTNGPILTWSPRVDGSRLRGTIEVESREPLKRVEIVANGEVVWTKELNGAKRRVRASFDVPANGRTWAVARSYAAVKDTVRMAHTSPFELPGTWNAEADARYFVDWIDELLAKPAVKERSELTALYRQARDFYSRRVRIPK